MLASIWGLSSVTEVGVRFVVVIKSCFSFKWRIWGFESDANFNVFFN